MYIREHGKVELIGKFFLPLQILQNRLQAFLVFVLLCVHVPADEVVHCMLGVLWLIVDGVVVSSGVLLQGQELLVELRGKLRPSLVALLEGRISEVF